jgi:TolA-binding protein
MPMRLGVLAFLLAATAVAPAIAQSDALPPIGDRVYKLEKEMRAVQRKVFPGANPDYFEPQITAPEAQPAPVGTPATSAVQDLTQRVSALEQQLQQLTNQSEENGHRLTILEQQYAKLKGDTDYRLGAIEGAGGAAAGAAGAAGAAAGAAPFGPQGRAPVSGKAPPPRGQTMGDQSSDLAAPAPAPAAPAAPATPAMPVIAKTGDAAEDSYMLGYALWSQKRYAEAETQLKKVVDKYPTSKRASYAQNLLGRAYYDDGQLTSAADAFLTSYKKYPKGERAPDSLYYLGQTLTKLKKLDQACQVYDEFRDVYGPTANATLKARVTQGRQDAKCGA